jgi:hypothetical protein
MKNLFKTKTAASIIGFGLAVVIPTVPTISKATEDIILRRVPVHSQADVTSLLSVFSALLAATAGLASRYSKGDCYTPKGLPGKDSPDPDDFDNRLP